MVENIEVSMNSESQEGLLADVRSNLRKSSVELSQWKLHRSAKWAAEALCGMPEISSSSSLAQPTISQQMEEEESPLRKRIDISLQSSIIHHNNFGLSEQEYDLYLLASSLFDCKEFDRCGYFIKKVTNPCLMFFKLYCEYLSWDKKTRGNMESVLTTGKNPRTGSFDPNGNGEEESDKDYQKKDSRMAMTDGQQDSLSTILKELDTYLDTTVVHQSSGIGLALLYYLKGILLKLDDNKTHAMSFFLKSLSYYSFNWACWLELLDCLSRPDESLLLVKYLEEKFRLEPPENMGSQADPHQNVMIRFFKLVLFQEFSGNTYDFTHELEYLHGIFPDFSYLKAQNALINYNYMDYVSSEALFNEVVKSDPYRLDDLDTYSNILYVMQKHSKLAYLAQFTSQVDKFRPETCCIVANYYSARQEHEKSIMYFRRALTLNKNCTSAWTLMGHEFVELKNSHAAIECYRRAVDINSRDFKAWYGLGQAYEVLDMHLYSLYYFQKACTLKPLDRRMWQALAACYAKVGNRQEAIKCYERALQLSLHADQDSVILYRLAELCEQIHEFDSCKDFMIRCVEVEKLTEGLVTDETAKARLWLAKYEAKRKNFEEAYNYAVGVSHGTSQEIEEARAIARECRRRIQ
ncbi:CDC23 (YHR166C) [Zygosaccharomyces parabailii]|nr:CDC23 (YHR166C) [Zygosaccharomyces parabailii]CDH12411.1 probable Anaphase-promoting complex subunit CDC23 [Zygosaccharomyces bailii ISA1307]